MENESPLNRGHLCAVLGAGEICDYGAVNALIRGAFIICADGGLGHCEKLGVRPDLLVGDFDSLTGSIPVGVEVLRLSHDKDYPDSTVAIEKALERGFEKLLLAGMTGGRLDHTLANLQNLADLASRGTEALLTDGMTDVRVLTGGQRELILQPRGNCYFSLLAHSRCEGVTIKNAKYPLEDYTLLNTSPRAISNEFTGLPVRVTIRRGTLLIVVTPQ